MDVTVYFMTNMQIKVVIKNSQHMKIELICVLACILSLLITQRAILRVLYCKYKLDNKETYCTN